jgi:hypothetical protein
MTNDSPPRRTVRVVVSHPAALVRAVTTALAIPIAGPILLTAVGKAIGPDGGGPPGWFGLAMGLFVALGALIGTLGAVRSREKGLALVVEPDALVIGSRRIAKRDIESGILVLQPTHDRVELQLQGGDPMVIDLPLGEGAPLLDELGLGTTQRRARIPLATPGEQAIIGFGGGAVGLIGLVMLFGLMTMFVPQAVLTALLASPAFSPAAAGVAAFAALGAGLVFARSTPDVVIGVDGVSHAEPGIGRRGYTFTPFSEVERVEVEEFGTGRVQAARVVLVRRDAEPTVVATLHVGKRVQIEAIASRVRAALTAYRTGGGGAASALERASAPVGSWLESLRQLARKGNDYRTASLDTDRLAELVADPKAAPDVRVGAAVVLAERGDENARTRVRVAADAVASPRLRIALESVAAGATDEEAVAVALEGEEEASRAEAASPPRGSAA